MKPYDTQGFTLIELLIILGIIMLLANMAVPSLTKLIHQEKITAEVNRLTGAIQVSRNTAATHSSKVTLCPSNDGRNCSKNWSSGYLAFIDKNGDRKRSSNEAIITQHKNTNKNIQLNWRAFGTKHSLQWLPTGITNHQNGSFEYCYKNKPKLSRGLYITKAGRVRLSKDKNKDGIHETASGKNIRCGR